MNNYYLPFIFLILFCLIHSEFKIEEITFSNEEILFENLTENKYYHIQPNFTSHTQIPNYIKVVVRDNNANNESYLNYINYVISYYQNDKTFTNRKQLSYGSLNTIIMWLKNEQFYEGFYLSIESSYKTCNYSFEIYPKTKAELLRGEQYSYYITEENKEMIFSIKNNNFKLKNSFLDYINFWAKGSDNNDIEVSIKGNYSNYQNDYQKHSKYNAYLLKVRNLEYYEFEIEIKGKPGDLISIGTLCCTQDCTIDYFYNGIEYYGLLKKGNEINCFLEDMIAKKDYQFIAVDNFNKIIDWYRIQSCFINITTSELECIPYICIEMPSNYDELLYSFKSLKTPSYNNGYNFKLYPLQYGSNYSIGFSKNITYKFFPFYSENFDYITYNIQTEQISNVSIFNCDNYPLCIFSPNENLKNTPIQRDYGSYSFSFKKNDISNWSPIGKNQKLLVITCSNSTSGYNNCHYLIRIYTDKSLLYIKSSYKNEYKIIRKGNTDHLAIYDLTYVSIETLSGNISIDFDNNTTEHYSNNNINSYIIKKDIGQKILFLNIKGENNSVYSIKTHKETITKANLGIINEIYFSFGNSLFKLEKNETLESFIFSFYSNYKSYFSLYPIGCEIDISNASLSYNDYGLTPLSLNYGYYHEIFNNSRNYRYISIKPKNKTCFIFSSFFLLDNSLYDNGIILEYNYPQRFLFNNNFNDFTYIYYFAEIENKININIHLLNKSKYKIILYINDNKLKDIYNIEKNKTIEVKKKNLENICKNVQQISKLSFNVLLDSSNNENSLIEITINSEETTNNSKIKISQKQIILIISFSIIGIILILLIVFCICKYKNKNNFENEIKNLSKEKDSKLI